jgi:hypothetical protein
MGCFGEFFGRKNPSHKMLMSVLGGMSESERQHIQARVRAAMDAQVLNEGRHQGGRAPFGYLVVDGGCHPNPRKPAEGYRLRVLAIDEEAADVVRRIFADYLDGKGDRAIAEGLNRDGVPRLRHRRHRPRPAVRDHVCAGDGGDGVGAQRDTDAGADDGAVDRTCPRAQPGPARRTAAGVRRAGLATPVGGHPVRSDGSPREALVGASGNDMSSLEPNSGTDEHG